MTTYACPSDSDIWLSPRDIIVFLYLVCSQAIIGDGLGQPLDTEALPATILLPKVDCLEDLIIVSAQQMAFYIHDTNLHR